MVNFNFLRVNILKMLTKSLVAFLSIFIINLFFLIEVNSEEKQTRTIIIGEHLGYVNLPLIQPSSCFEEERFCLNNYETYKIKVEEIITGDQLEGVIYASRFQHGRYIYSSDETSLFVLERIEDKNTSELLKTSYFLKEYIRPQSLYCFPSGVSEKYPELESIVTSECVETSDMPWRLRSNWLDDFADNIELTLSNKKVLVSFEEGYSLNGVFHDYEIEDSDRCSDYLDESKYNKDPACQIDTQAFDSRRFLVKKGWGEKTKSLINSKLANSSLNLQNTSIEIKVIENKGYTLVEWLFLVPRVESN